MTTRSGDGTAGEGRVVARYRALVSSGEISEDRGQLALCRRLDDLDRQVSKVPDGKTGGLFGWLFGARPEAPPTGLYVHGGVGRGKTMLMDEFYAAADLQAKRRDHFHAFMADVHDRIHAFRAGSRNGDAASDDPIAPVAADIAAATRLLCLDEFAVEDIADAMILSRLFSALFAQGLVLVATSNTAPEDLYRHGLNRPLFLPFVDVLKRHVEVVELDAGTDHRLAKLGGAGVYVTPADGAAHTVLNGFWRSLTGGAAAVPAALTVKGRTLEVPAAAGRVARFGFADLCDTPLGTADFAAIADAFDTVIIDDVPVIASERRDVARRFINLVDVFYDRGIKLIASAAAEPEGLYVAAQGKEAFAFRRTVSRLIEMRSEAYLSADRADRGAAARSSPAV